MSDLTLFVLGALATIILALLISAAVTAEVHWIWEDHMTGLTPSLVERIAAKIVAEFFGPMQFVPYSKVQNANAELLTKIITAALLSDLKSAPPAEAGEREKIVAWHHRQAAGYEAELLSCSPGHQQYNRDMKAEHEKAADAIERGDFRSLPLSPDTRPAGEERSKALEEAANWCADEADRYDALTANGQGQYGTPSYIRDADWNRWLGAANAHRNNAINLRSLAGLAPNWPKPPAPDTEARPVLTDEMIADDDITFAVRTEREACAKIADDIATDLNEDAVYEGVDSEAAARLFAGQVAVERVARVIRARKDRP